MVVEDGDDEEAAAGATAHTVIVISATATESGLRLPRSHSHYNYKTLLGAALKVHRISIQCDAMNPSPHPPSPCQTRAIF